MIDDLKGFFDEQIYTRQVNIILPISYSDSIWYLTKDGEAHHIPVFSDIKQQEDVPHYNVSGKPKNSQLLGIAHQLMHLKKNVGLENIKTILPTSTFVAAMLTGKNYWNTWDRTHASNSGMWDYENNRWCQQMQPFIQAGVIRHKVVNPDCILHIEPSREQKWLIGGHDSVFAVANDTPYSAKPYLSLGTWITASVEGWFKHRAENNTTRFVIAPNGTILEQLCFRANENQHDKAIRKTMAFFERRLPKGTQPRRINVFGGWSKDGQKMWKKANGFEFVHKDQNFNDFLHNEAVKYALEKYQNLQGQKVV